MVDLIRRIAVFAVSLALLLGPAWGVAYAACTSTTMGSIVTSDAHASGKCPDCGPTKSGMSAGACATAYCSGLTAFPPETKVSFDALPANMFLPGKARHVSGRAEAPDPYPPKTTILN